MRIAVARETDSAEDRVAATPETVRKMKGLGAEVLVEPGAGVKSGIPDGEYAAAGATDLMLGFADFPATGMLERFARDVTPQLGVRLTAPAT